MNTNQQNENQLQRTMKSRHLFMISLGGVIGTGFFLSTGYTINQAGPLGAVLSYLVGGFIMFLTMLCLGELAVALPVSGSFQTYATKFISPAFGFAFGWLYWLGWAVTCAIEFLSAGQLMLRWFPHVGVWVWCLVFVGLMFILNAITTKAFAESEFWFSGIKILVILLFIILGGAAMFGLIDLKHGAQAPFFTHFYEDGLFPNGIKAMLITMITVNFAFQGTELIGVAAGESEDPEKTIPRSIRQTVWRTLVFFVLSIIVIAGMIPWKQAGVVESPFVVVFEQIGIPYAADIMNFVILIALLSVANSGLFASTRILYAMANEGQAFKALGKTNKRGVPLNALIVTLAVACLSLLSKVAAPETVYMFLLSLAGLSAQVGWITISLSQLMFRRKYIREGGKVEDLKFKTPLYPVLPLVGLTLNTVVLISLAFDSEQRLALYCGIPFMVICFIVYHLYVKKHKQSDKHLEL
ncbi:amino acid permease [Bacillus nakamurai]|uniref:amino acid permease n=1 Tax=Bacillus nakamurai TaxID=1793963 RepID=UPI0009EE539B|nr:amino acid permease [Bacillus nakamurai]MED1227789.1 amino acid permease [Bacillus nakamurai]